MGKELITGSEGFVGQHLIHELEKDGQEIFGTTLHIPESGLPENIFQCDITKPEELRQLIEKLRPQTIFHLAGQPKPGLSFKEPQMTFEINTIGTINLLEAVKAIPEYKPRIILIGSSEEHGAIPTDQMPITEESPLNPNNPYAVSKLACWYIAKQYVQAFGFDIVYVTPFNHTGPGQSEGFLAPDVASQIAKIEKGLQEPVLLTGDLSSERDISDVRDVVRAYRLLSEKGKAGERYIISSGKSVPVSTVVDTLIKNATVEIKREVDPKRNRPSDVPLLYGSHDKLTRETGWEPEIPLEQTLKDLLDWYRQNG